jgi:hypothetical protein
MMHTPRAELEHMLGMSVLEENRSLGSLLAAGRIAYGSGGLIVLQ